MWSIEIVTPRNRCVSIKYVNPHVMIPGVSGGLRKRRLISNGHSGMCRMDSYIRKRSWALNHELAGVVVAALGIGESTYACKIERRALAGAVISV